MGSEGGRPQDQDRRHRRAGRPSAETATTLRRYQSAMRDALVRVLDRIEAKPSTPAEPGQLGLVAPLSMRDEAAAWDLAIKLGRELGTEIDPAGGVGGSDEPAAPARPRRSRKIDW